MPTSLITSADSTDLAHESARARRQDADLCGRTRKAKYRAEGKISVSSAPPSGAFTPRILAPMATRYTARVPGPAG